MSRVISPVSGKPYGLAAVCRAWRLARSGVYRHQRTMLQPQRRGPLGAMSDDALTTAIQDVLAASPFHGEGHRKVWARLRYAGTRSSLRRVLRLMRQNNLLAPARIGSPRGPRNHDGTIIPDTVNVMWGTDLTTTITGGLSRSIIAPLNVSGSTRIRRLPASKPWSRSGTACGSASAVRQGDRPWSGRAA